jgi:hypothetical protein
MAGSAAGTAKSSCSRSVRAKGAARRRRRLTPGVLIRAVVVVLLGLYVAWWAVTTSIVNAEVNENPFLAARAEPDNPRVRISLAMVYFLLRGGRVPEESRRSALEAVNQAPLADEPFLLAGVNALAAGRNAEGERLLTEARRRNPRLRLARLLLLDRYLREQRVKEAVGEMKALGGLIGAASSLLTPALAKMAQDPATAPQMLPLLRTQPALQESVLENLVASGADVAVILHVAGPAARTRNDAPWKARVLAGLVANHRIAYAWQLWKTFTGREGDSGDKGLYDAGFAGLPGPPPFNWDLANGGAGAAERSPSHALQVEYYGRDNASLASQLMMLRPGRYRLSFRAGGDASGEGSRLAWNVACEEGGAPLLQLPITRTASTPKAFAGVFTVPASGCAAQWIRLNGISGDVESRQSVTIDGLSIKPEGGA